MAIQFIHDFVDPKDPRGRTFKEINMEKTHSLPVGSLVEITTEDSDSSGVRMFVAACWRDCDGTPLYWLAYSLEEVAKTTDFYDRNRQYRHWHGGWSEDSLALISLPDEKRLQSIKDWTDQYDRQGY